MAEDWAADVKRFAPDAEDAVIAGIVRYCGIALQKRDSSLVSMTDPAETKRVRENFLKKKLALTDADAVLDAAIAEVGQIMKAANFKNRVTVYYLLVDKFGRHDRFRKTTTTKAKASAKAKPAADAALPAAAGLGTAGVIATASAVEPEAVVAPAPSAPAPTPAPEPVAVAAPPPPVEPAVARFADVAQPAAAPPAPVTDDGKSDGLSWLWWLLGLALIGLLIWWLFLR